MTLSIVWNPSNRPDSFFCMTFTVFTVFILLQSKKRMGELLMTSLLFLKCHYYYYYSQYFVL